MRNPYAIAGSLILVLIAASVLFGTDFFGLNMLRRSPAQLMSDINQARTGGYAITFSEADSPKWRLASGHRLERLALDESGSVFARLSSGVPLDRKSVAWADLGLSSSLGVDFNNRTNGQTIEIGFAARSSKANGSDEI